MGNRLTKIYTRTGDKGETGLGDGSRVAKSSLRIRCLGLMDELNASIAIVIAHKPDITVSQVLTSIQHELFDLGGELCIPDRNVTTQSYVDNLETQLDKFNEKLEPLKEFILPGGCLAASFCHQARTVCRRTEIKLSQLQELESINPISLSYINRLSDLLFVTARYINLTENSPDVLWQPGLRTQD